MCCQLFRCFGWCLDIVQRVITFALASILCCALCCGVIVALGAGIAYGYNISLVEFLDLKETDITVYVRRGQFGDKPSFKTAFRRTGGDEPDMFASNYSADYPELKLIDHTPLSDAWQKAQDTSNYAEKLTKYSKAKSNAMRLIPGDGDDKDLEVLPLRPTVDASKINPVQFVPDKINTSNAEPRMRNFLPEYRPPYSQNGEPAKETTETRRINRKNRHKQKKPEVKMDADDDTSPFLQPDASKFLYRKEDFDDADVEITSKPV